MRVSSNLHKEAAFAALKSNVTLNDFVKGAISYAIEPTEVVNSGVAG